MPGIVHLHLLNFLSIEYSGLSGRPAPDVSPAFRGQQIIQMYYLDCTILC